MKESDFYNALSSQRAAQAAPEGMAARIDQEIAAKPRTRTVATKRLFLAFGAAALVATVSLYPSMKAYAAMTKMKRAIEQTGNVRVRTYTVRLDGKSVRGDTLYFRNGESAVVDATGHVSSLSKQMDHYDWDPKRKTYVKRQRKAIEVPLISEALNQSSPLGMKVENIRINGKLKIKAVVDNSSLNERYIFIADPKTNLIETYRVESQDKGGWRFQVVGDVEYPKVQEFPKLEKTAPVIEERRFVTIPDGRETQDRRWVEAKPDDQSKGLRWVEVKPDNQVKERRWVQVPDVEKPIEKKKGEQVTEMRNSRFVEVPVKGNDSKGEKYFIKEVDLGPAGRIFIAVPISQLELKERPVPEISDVKVKLPNQQPAPVEETKPKGEN